MTTMLALVLSYNPQLVYSTGFQLSVAAVFGILLLTKPLKSLVEHTLLRPLKSPPRQLSNLICVPPIVAGRAFSGVRESLWAALLLIWSALWLELVAGQI
jgi:predicted membrane metal-binding protein